MFLSHRVDAALAKVQARGTLVARLSWLSTCLPGAQHLPENELPRFAIRPLVPNTPFPQTLSFLFTDIEGSTPLWDTQREAMREATVQHNAILRRAIATHGGNAFRVVGDAFCVAFQDADGAMLAAIA